MTIGLNIAGGEFGGLGGKHGKQYHYPTYSELQFYKDKGVDLIRLPFTWERVQHALGGPLDTSGDLALLKQVLVDAAKLGLDVIIDNHNYGRFKGVALGAAGGPTPAQFADFWKKMAVELKDYPALVGYDLMNEPNRMPTATIWKESAQAATDAIRTVDMVNTIIVEGDHWAGADDWATSSNAKLIIDDPANNIVYQAHLYLDRDGSGKYRGSYDAEGAYPNIGPDRLKGFVDWLNDNGLKGMIGEFGVPSDDLRWIEAQKKMLDYMVANGLDGTAWAGGAWWSTDYEMYTARPGKADSAFGNLLEKYYGRFDGFESGSAPIDPAPVPPAPVTPKPVPPAPVSRAPSVAINDAAVSESARTISFTVTRKGDLASASSVDFTTRGGTASAGSDYTALSGKVNFAPGEASKLVTISIINDARFESHETILVRLSGGKNVTIADGSGTGTIRNDDASPAPSTPQSWVPSKATVLGTDGNNNINARASTIDYVDAKGGDDVIAGVGSRDYIDGGTGSDTISYHWSGARVDVDLMRASQRSGDANGDVLVNIENVTGSNGNDLLAGNNGANVLNGLGGQDTLTGRGGKDRFVFSSAADANGDVVTDFRSGDKLDFSRIDANAGRAGNQAFTWLDTGKFTGAAGQLREYDLNGVHYVAGDVDGDRVADFTIKLSGVSNLNAGDLLL
jgi:aryl-phospho-beta-D-glucosidase BglC (GH1 family)